MTPGNYAVAHPCGSFVMFSGEDCLIGSAIRWNGFLFALSVLSSHWRDEITRNLRIYYRHRAHTEILLTQIFALEVSVRILPCFQEEMIVQEDPIELEKMVA